MKKDRFANPICAECKRCQLAKYKNFVDDNGQRYENFSVRCSGIPEQYLSEKLMSFLQKEEQEEALGIFDPVTWARLHLRNTDGTPWVARFYQEQILRCTAGRRVLRIGRRAGKCLIEGTSVMTPTGPVEIQNLRPGDIVYGYDPATQAAFPTHVVALHDQGAQEVIDLRRRGDAVATCTTNHRWLATRYRSGGYKEPEICTADNADREMNIIRHFVPIPHGNISEPHAYAIAALLGDGCSRQEGRKLHISSESGAIPTKVATVLGYRARKRPAKNYTWLIEGESNFQKIECHHYNEWCRDKKAHEKIVDMDVIKGWDRKSCVAFLAGLLDTDGSVEDNGKELTLRWMMQARPIIEAVQYLLYALFQCKAKIHVDSRDKYVNGPVYSVGVKNILHAKRILAELDSELVTEKKKYQKHYDNYLPHNEVGWFLGCVPDFKSQRSAHCWDITVESKDSLFLTADGLVTHNTQCLAVDALHRAMTIGGSRILIVTPYKAQAQEVVDRIMEFRNSSPDLEASITRYKESPYFRIEFGNKSWIHLFSSGVKSGAEAGQVRGTDADRIYLDEADYLSDGDLTALIAILATHSKTELWASSTPTGRRSQFWKWCTKAPRYKEFFFPTWVKPDWDIMEQELRSEYAGRSDDWLHEIAAEFGEESVGVFQHQFVDAAKTLYKYEEQARKPGWTYCMGIDWNTDVGTEMVVTGYDGRGGYMVVDALNVPKQGWTQLAGMESVIDMNAKWRPAFIYADAGAGGTNIELLQKYGFDAAAQNPADPAAMMQTHLKAYNFSSKIPVYSPLTKQEILKPAKPFLIENVVRRFEEGSLKISSFDSVLVQQLENYIIKYRTEAGLPVYAIADERVGDHRLDAFALSLVAFKLEMSDFASPTHVSRIALSPSFAHGQISPQDVNPEKREAVRLARLPGYRYDLGNAGIAPSNMPGRVDGREVKTNRPGWATDEEEKYLRQYQLRQLRKRAKRIRHKPERQNI